MTTVLESLNSALHRAFADDARVLLLGQDVLDPYGGAFKVTRGLSTRFPDRVLTAPVSEAGIVGVGAGMALRGLRPVVEIMFGDFVALAADQLVNHVAKFRWMYNEQVRLPLVIRTPMGGRRGYGPTHSQTLEKLYLGLPGLRVIAPTALGEPGDLLYDVILNTEDPVLFIENKLLYATPLHGADLAADFTPYEAVQKVQDDQHTPLPVSRVGSGLTALGSDNSTPASGGLTNRLAGHFTASQGIGDYPTPTYSLSLRGAPLAQVTITAYGYMAELALQAARRLAYEHEVFVDLVVPTELSAFDLDALFSSLERTRSLLTVEEGTYTLGWGAEVVARAAERLGSGLRASRRVAAQDLPVLASGPLEAAVLPGVDEIVSAALSLSKSI